MVKVPSQLKAQKKGLRKTQNPSTPIMERMSSVPVTQGQVMSYQGMNRSRSRRFRGCELIGPVSGDNGTITVTNYGLNPGLPLTFPRLSTEASMWEQYRFHSLKFTYINACASTTPGSIILSPDYDSSDFLPDSEVTLANTQDAKEGFPWGVFSISLDPTSMHPLGPRKFIRNGSTNTDLKMTDAGRLSIARLANGTTNTIGKLWVDYDVELFVPIYDRPTALVTPNLTQYNLPGTQSLNNGVAEIAEFDELSTFAGNQHVTWTNTDGLIVPPRGTYVVDVDLVTEDDTPEDHSIEAHLFINGADTAIPVISSNFVTNTGGDRLYTHISSVIAVSGSDTVSVSVTIVGAGGLLTLCTDQCRIRFIPI